jgi:spore maturation protein CgeB
VKALYIGDLSQGGTCLERAKVLADFGWEVLQFDIIPYLRGSGRICAALQHRLLLGPDVARFNQDVVRITRPVRRLDVIWVDKGRWLHAAALDEMKRTTGAITVHYTPDPAFTVHNSRHFDACLRLYELCITTKRYELDTYRSKGTKEVLFTWQGVDDRFERIAACGTFDTRPVDVAFVGHVEPHYVKILECAGSVTKNISVNGPGWERIARRLPAWQGIASGPVWADALPATLARGRIGLGLLSKLYPDAFTTRSFEVPAAGAMLLAERTADHLEIYEEDREAVFFDSQEELCDKLKFYLAHEDIRRRIAEAGRTRVLANYHWRHVLAPAIRRVEEVRNAG